MTHHDASRLQSLFASALERPDEARAQFLENACAGDADLLAELQRLLAIDAQLAGMTARVVGLELTQIVASTAPQSSLTGTRVGAFELREELGCGGMGSVYRAERVDGNVQQEVAIKFVRRELLDANTRRRFQLERQLMATLQHPNIARLLDAAELADGTPYFVMEYVRGIPITDYCARESLDVRERVELMRRVCGAVAEAHRELIVHRDLKPGNILISNDGTPKLLDFGIAKSLGPLAGMAVREDTGTALRYFSPNYAAPEQVMGSPVGIACDIYALGQLLYELLAGCRPFDFSQLSAGQIERLIIQVPPPAPSAALARNTTAGAHIRPRQLQGDLDGIVMRCLRKAPNERYASVEQLEADLDNFLEGRPVQARGGHGWYRAQKFVRRNKVAVAASLLVAVSLLGGIVAFALQARIAQQRAAELEQVSNFQAEMLSQVDPTKVGVLLTADVKARLEAALVRSGVSDAERAVQSEAFAAQWNRVNATDAARNLIDRTILKPAVEAIGQQFRSQPIVDATLREALSDLYRKLALYDAALVLQEEALATRRRVLGDTHPDTLSSLNRIGDIQLARQKWDEAEVYFREALDKRRRTLGEDHAATAQSLENMGVLLWEKGQLSETEVYIRQALATRRRVLGDTHPDTLNNFHNLGALLLDQGKLPEAETYLRDVLEKRRRVLGNENPFTLITMNHVALVLDRQEKFAEAETYYRETLDIRRRVLGAEHPDTTTSIYNMAGTLRRLGKHAEAEPYAREAVENFRRVLGDEHYFTLIATHGLGSVLRAQGKDAEAVEWLTRSEAATRRSFAGEDKSRLSKFALVLGKARLGLRQFAAAEASLIEANELLGASVGAIPADHRDSIRSIVELYDAWHAAEPAKGYGAKSADWQRKLDALNAAAPSASTAAPK